MDYKKIQFSWISHKIRDIKTINIISMTVVYVMYISFHLYVLNQIGALLVGGSCCDNCIVQFIIMILVLQRDLL